MNSSNDPAKLHTAALIRSLESRLKSISLAEE
jgi:hypothetical protein